MSSKYTNSLISFVQQESIVKYVLEIETGDQNEAQEYRRKGYVRMKEGKGR